MSSSICYPQDPFTSRAARGNGGARAPIEAGLVIVTARLVSIGVPQRLLSWACVALALGLLARAVGECPYVGFFKRVRGSRFATLDTMLHSPRRPPLAIGVGWVAAERGF